MKKVMLLFIFIMLLSGCLFEKDDKKEKEEVDPNRYLSIYEETKLIEKIWEKPIVHPYETPVIPLNEDIIVAGSNFVVRITEEGEVKWKNKTNLGQTLSRAVLMEEKLWLIEDKNIKAFDIESGELIYNETIDEGRIVSYMSGYYDGKLYFINRYDYTGEEEFDGQFGNYKLQEWSITEKKILREKKLQYADFFNHAGILVEDGVVYFENPANTAKKIAAKITALNIDDWSIKWQYRLPEGEIDTIDGTSKDYVSTVLRGSNIIVEEQQMIFSTDSGLISLNKKTGEKEWSLIAPFDVKRENGTNGSDGDLLYDKKNKRIYYMSAYYDFDYDNIIEAENSEENIFCVDIEKGEKIWARGTGFTETGTPALREGYLYIPSGRKMMVVDAETGDTVAGMWYEQGLEGEMEGQSGYTVGFIGDLGLVFGNGAMAFKPVDME